VNGEEDIPPLKAHGKIHHIVQWLYGSMVVWYASSSMFLLRKRKLLFFI
jgi:hypothetical protein